MPYVTKDVRVLVDGTTIIETVELVALEVSREGNVESKYGKDFADGQYKPRNRHKVGMKRARFTLRKWYKADATNTNQLYDLFDNDTEFSLAEYTKNITGVSGLQILNCIVYKYASDTGTANDIIIEEIQGEGLTYEAFTFTGCPSGEQIVNGGFEINDGFWSTTGWNPNVAVVNTEHHSGSWCADITVYMTGYIKETFSSPILRECVSSFTFWAKSTYMSMIVTLSFSDNPDRIASFSDFIQVWKEWNILTLVDDTDGLPLFPSDKHLSAVKIMQAADNDLYIDDVSLIAG